MGILDVLQGLSANPAAQQGLLGAGLGMLAANRGGTPLGAVIGQGGLLGMNAYSNAAAAQREAQQQSVQQQLYQQQIAASQADEAMKQQQLAQAQRSFQMQQGILEQFGLAPPQGTQQGAGVAGAPPMLSTPAAAPSALGGTMAGAGQDTGAAPLQPVAAAAPAAGGQGGAQPAQPGAGGGMFGGYTLANIGQAPADIRAKAAMALDAAGMKPLADSIRPQYEWTPGGLQVDKTTGTFTGRTAPIVDAQGHAIQMQPNAQGGFDVTIPQGSLQSFTSFRNADEAAKAGWHITTQKDKNGNEYYTTDANIISQIPGGAPGSQPGGAGGQGGGMGGTQQGGPAAGPQGGTAGGPAGTGPLAAPSPQRMAYLGKMSDFDATNQTGMRQSLLTLPQKIDETKELGNALDQWNTSKSTEAQANLQGVLKKYLPDYKWVPGAGGDSLANQQLVQNLSASITADMKNQMGMQRLTDSDLAFLNRATVSTATDPQTVKTIIDTRVRMMQRQQVVAEMAQKWAKKYDQLSGTDANGNDFYSAIATYNQTHPLFSDLKLPAAPAAGTMPASPAAPAAPAMPASGVPR